MPRRKPVPRTEEESQRKLDEWLRILQHGTPEEKAEQQRKDREGREASERKFEEALLSCSREELGEWRAEIVARRDELQESTEISLASRRRIKTHCTALISWIDAQIKRLPPPSEERLRRIDSLIAELQRERSEVLNEIATKEDFE